ncbi:efflux RND transporter periplasmic adaptor subunit [Sphingomonas sp. TZW2008]|uniref:efflux RND transporter periplasmic adaptor subunit n=1 Tax=Sphingomonas sp. TZW2008 TaxID=1917973 RepID=UPI000A266F2D|nr:efflux RND transporter periplasmic adaptor subunit [Sphingomonas sp. TZW2008]
MARVVWFGVIAVIGALAGCDKAEIDPRTLPPVVRIATAQPGGATGRSFSGVVAARVQSDLGFRVGGRIVRRLVNVGDTVRAGQELMRLDASDLGLAAAAQGQAVAAARARAVQATSEERRYRDLVAAGAVSALVYDQAKTAAAAATAQVRAAEAQAGTARNAARYAVLRASTAGVIVETLAEPGQVVAAGQPVLRVAEAGPREAVVNLPETIRPAIGSIASATLYGDGVSGEEQGGGGGRGPARLRQLSDAADPRTRTFEARYVLGGGAAGAALGSTVSIALADAGGGGGGDGGGVRVPIAALRDAGRGPGVWVLAPDQRHVRWRPVTLAALGDEDVTIGRGLRAGEAFVTMGAHLLRDGQAVRPTRASGAGL